MADLVVLRPLRSQTLQANLGAAQYSLKVYSAAGGMCYDMTRNNVVITRGQRIVAGTPLIPYRYLEDGNFILTTEDNDLPDYNKFSDTQNLLYFGSADLEVLSSGV